MFEVVGKPFQSVDGSNLLFKAYQRGGGCLVTDWLNEEVGEVTGDVVVGSTSWSLCEVRRISTSKTQEGDELARYDS